MAFFDKLNQVAKNLGDMTNDALETNKLNSKINAENNAAEEELKKIGEYYYNQYITTGEAVPEIIEFCNNAKAHYEEAAKAQAEIDRIKAENEAAKAPAPQPVTPVAPAATKRFCTECGAVASPGVKFCSECGQRLEG